VLLDVPAELAAERAENRANAEADRAKDVYERNDGLQRRTGEVYAALAAKNWCGQWMKAGPDVDPSELAASLTR
jgi:dTMP kinase